MRCCLATRSADHVGSGVPALRPSRASRRNRPVHWCARCLSIAKGAEAPLVNGRFGSEAAVAFSSRQRTECLPLTLSSNFIFRRLPSALLVLLKGQGATRDVGWKESVAAGDRACWPNKLTQRRCAFADKLRRLALTRSDERFEF